MRILGRIVGVQRTEQSVGIIVRDFWHPHHIIGYFCSIRTITPDSQSVNTYAQKTWPISLESSFSSRISLTLWTTHCLKPMGFLLRRPRNLLSPQALIRAVPALCCYSFYAICLNPSSSIFFAALISLSWFVPQTGHIHSLTDRFFVSVFWYPQAEHSWLLA